MTVDWHAITPWASLAGGGLIGVLAGRLARLNGRISGVSGVLAGLLVPVKGETLRGDSPSSLVSRAPPESTGWSRGFRP